MEALKLTDAGSFWEELMRRDKNLVFAVDERGGGMPPELGLKFENAISAAGPVLVAMKGATWGVAPRLARELRCTHVRYDDVCSSAPNMDDLLFLQQEVLWEVSSSQLSLGHSVIAHSPRLDRQQVDRLLDLADSRGALLVIIDCSDLDPSVTESGHMPEIGPPSPSDRSDVPVLVIKTFDPPYPFFMPIHDLDEIVLEFIVLCMDIKSRCQKEVANESLEPGKSQLRHFSHPHLLTLQECIGKIEADCCVCSTAISGLYYTCPSCKFFVHRSCAELPQYVEASLHAHPLRLVVLCNERENSFKFLGEFAYKFDDLPSITNPSPSDSSCIICNRAGERPFYRCWQCYDYFIHYECAMSTAGDIDHSCHVHTLKLRTFNYSRVYYKFTCYACGAEGCSISYNCADCHFHFHLKCVLKIPLSVQHKRHEHPLILSSPPKDETNEYYCEVCETRRHPDYWIYYCRPCEYEAHLSCANPDIPPYSITEDGELPGECISEISDDLPQVIYSRTRSRTRSRSRSSRSRSRSRSRSSTSRSRRTSPLPISATRSSSLNGHQVVRDEEAASTDDQDGKCKMARRICVHERILDNQYQENLAAMIIAVKGHPCTGRSTVAQLLAKALKCTLITYDRVRECISRAQKGLSQPQCPSTEPLSELSYQVLWRMAKTQLERNHHVVIDLPLSRRVHLDQLLSLAKSADAIVIIVECGPQDHIELQRSFEKCQVAGGDDGASSSHKPSSGKDIEVPSEQLEYEDSDARGVQVPKLMVDTTSVNGLEEQIESAKKLIISCLHDKFNLERVLEDIDIVFSECVQCREAFIRRKSAGLPTSFKHEADQHELRLQTSERLFAYGSNFRFTCNACTRFGDNIYYYCDPCGLRFHPKCVLELPLTVQHERDEHALALSPSVKDDTYQYYCDVCEERRGADDWIYYCEGCDYQAHVTCVIDPQFFHR